MDSEETEAPDGAGGFPGGSAVSSRAGTWPRGVGQALNAPQPPLRAGHVPPAGRPGELGHGLSHVESESGGRSQAEQTPVPASPLRQLCGPGTVLDLSELLHPVSDERLGHITSSWVTASRPSTRKEACVSPGGTASRPHGQRSLRALQLHLEPPGAPCQVGSPGVPGLWRFKRDFVERRSCF